jgi:hypothetical protein
MKKQNRQNKKKSKSRLKNAKNSFCNGEPKQGDNYKSHVRS